MSSIAPDLAPVSRTSVQKRSLAPAVGLFFLAPLVAEFLLGNLPIKLLPALIVLAPAYGGAALLIRETVRATNRSWPSILLLGMAYAIFGEGFITQSLFNPDYLSLKMGLLGPAFIPALGIGGWWTLWMFNVHALWSIATPIALVEATVPDRARAPWLGRAGRLVVAAIFLFGSGVTSFLGYQKDHFASSRAQFAGTALAVVALSIAAFLLPRGVRPALSGSVPPPWAVAALALAFGSAALLVPLGWGWGAVAAILGLDLVMLCLVLAWSRRSGWSLQHTLALASGAALAYGWHAFLQHPAAGVLDASVRAGNALFALGAVVLIWFAARRTAAANPSAGA